MRAAEQGTEIQRSFFAGSQVNYKYLAGLTYKIFPFVLNAILNIGGSSQCILNIKLTFIIIYFLSAIKLQPEITKWLVACLVIANRWWIIILNKILPLPI